MKDQALPQQSDWSIAMEKAMSSSFPELEFEIIRHSDESISMEIRKSSISLWVSSFSSEYTIGVDNTQTNTWHRHMSTLGANTIEEQTEELVKTFRSIVHDQVTISEVEPGQYVPEFGNRDPKGLQKHWSDFE